MDQSNQEISILVVEDEALTLEHLFLVLSRKYPKFRLYQASNGTAGLETFRVHNADIVITDITMPGISGLEMAAEIRGMKPDTKFITLTGDTGRGPGGSGFMIDYCIEKPVFLQELFEAIDSCVDAIA